MKTFIHLMIVVLSATSMLFSFGAKVVFGQNLVVNGDFELGNTGFTTDYTYSPGDLWPENTYTVDTNPQNPHSLFSPCGDHTTGTGNMMIVNGAVPPHLLVWTQSVAVVPNQTYELAAWATSVYPDSPARLQVLINDAPMGELHLSSATCQWQPFTTSWFSGTSTTATLSIIDLNTEPYGNDFALDDLSFAQARAVSTAIIPYLDRGYRFKVVPHGGGEGFEQPNFNDSQFSTGTAGFGIIDEFEGCPLNNPTDVKTAWPLDTDILLRKRFNLPFGATNLRVSVAVDNDVQVFINGQDISGGLQIHEGCAERDSFVFTAPDGVLLTGTNLLAVRGRDRGVLSYLDVRVTANLPLKCSGRTPTIVGTQGDDVLHGTAGPDVILGLGGNDTVFGKGGNNTICGGPGNDTLYGGPGADRLLGESGNDALNGGLGNDQMFGGTGNDTLRGGTGDDRLGGGTGADSCDGGSHVNGDTAVNCETVIHVP